MVEEEPRPFELSRRINDLGRRVDDGFRDLTSQLKDFPTEKTLIAIIERQDTQIADLREDIRNLTAALAAERNERMADTLKESGARERGDKAIEERADGAKRLAWQIAGVVAASMLGVLGFVLNLAGSPG